MPVTMEEVRAFLIQDEPNYRAAAARFGADALPHLLVLARDEGELLAPRAAALAGKIDDPEADRVIEVASNRAEPAIRVAAAAAAADRRVPLVAVLDRLLVDADVGVRKVAVRGVARRALVALRPKVEEVATRDPDLKLREIARRASADLQ